MNDFDALLHSLGAFGPYQRQIFILVSAFETPAAWAMLLPVFVGMKPDWSCHMPGKINPHRPYTTQSSLYGRIALMLLHFESGMRADNGTGQVSLNRSGVEVLSNFCPKNGTSCDSIVYDDSFTSIISEVFVGLVAAPFIPKNCVTSRQSCTDWHVNPSTHFWIPVTIAFREP